MELKDFYFDLPDELIAQTPVIDRTSSRLLIMDRETGEMEHKHFRDIVDYLESGDCLVLNNTRVRPARLIGERAVTKAKIEFLLLEHREDDTWEVMVRPGKKAKKGDTIHFGGNKLIGHILDVVEGGNRIVKFEFEGIFEEILDELGQMPLPPYITEKLEDKERYQTVYSKHEGSAAAPTAGLHFTNALLQQIKDKGIEIAYVTLHVGLGTFRPVKVDNIKEHEMHSEYYQLLEEDAVKINTAKKNNKRVVAVGTTSSRTLESIGDDNGNVKASSGYTDIFIYPGYKFKVVNALITNFHLPESTLIMLVSALSERELVLNAYEKAIEMKYRFFSFGDAMFIK